MPETNLKSDVEAKSAFLTLLRSRGYENPRVCAKPGDIIANRNSEVHYFELKFTRKTNRYFGAATLTEWMAGISFMERYTFVVAYCLDHEWKCDEYSVDEFMAISSIPPFKIFFRAQVPKADRIALKMQSKQVSLTLDRLAAMSELYAAFKSGLEKFASKPD